MYGIWWLVPDFFGEFDLLGSQSLLVISACSVWQILSIAHKKAVLAFQVRKNTLRIAVSFVIFQVCSYVFTDYLGLRVVTAVPYAILVSGLYYGVSSIAFRARVST